ncbi:MULTISPECIES: hypothetical protein [Bacillati]|uniref:hypothetical protein n=1 Tax=Bacillati TaxID=1783272 RepID=UPI003412CFD8
MGKNIVSWSPIHGQGGTTVNVAALASMFAIEYPSHSLITHTQLTYSPLELLFGKGNYAKGFETSGMTGLERLVKSQKLQPNTVRDYTETVYAKRLDILAGTKNKSYEQGLIEAVLSNATDAYDLLWIDAHSGSRNEITNNLLQEADIVLVNLPQNRFVLDRFFSGADFPEILKDKELIILISSYDENSSFSIKAIKRLYKTKLPMYPILYSHQFKDAANHQLLSEFFYKYKENRKEQPAYDYIYSLKAVNKVIAKKTGLYSNREDVDE